MKNRNEIEERRVNGKAVFWVWLLAPPIIVACLLAMRWMNNDLDRRFGPGQRPFGPQSMESVVH